jgi:hypothetical protein
MTEQTKQMTRDEILRRDYVNLITKSLKVCRNYSPTSLTFTPQETEALEHHLKNAGRGAVLEDTPTEDCVAVFVARITRVITQDDAEIYQIIDLMNQRQALLTPEETKALKAELKYFREKKPAE